MSCWSLLSLLAVDLFTIMLIGLLASHYSHRPIDILESISARSADPLPPPLPVPRGRSLDNPPEPPGNVSDTGPPSPGSGRALDIDGLGDIANVNVGADKLEPNANDTINAAIKKITEQLTKEMADLKTQLLKLSNPPSFSCHKTAEHAKESKLVYEGCSVTTAGMDSTTGIFTVVQPGVYQITFTGFFRSKNGHMLSADIYLRRKGSEVTPQIIGRASAKVDENGFAGQDDDLHTTTSVLVLEKLVEGDEVFVSMAIHGDHGDSSLWSDFSRKIHFTGFKVSD